MADKKVEETKVEESKSVFAEFREFIARGNMVDLAVGLTVGTAFTKLVNSLVQDVIMPPIGLALNNVNFSELYVNLGSNSYANLADAEKAGAPVLKYGAFITEIINFFIIALVIFFMVKAINRLRRQEGIPVLNLSQAQLKKLSAVRSTDKA